MKQFSSVDLMKIMKEAEIISNSRIDSVYNEGRNFVFHFYVTSKGKYFLKFEPGKACYFISEKEGEKKNGFVQYLNKLFANKRVDYVKQIGSERAVEISIGDYKIYIELFGKGNIIVVKKGIIENFFEKQKIEKNQKYASSKREFDFDVSFGKFSELFGNDEAVKVLSSLVGKKYADEICLSADVKKNAKDLPKKDLQNIFRGFQDLLKKDIKACIIYENNKAVDVAPFDLQIYKNHEKKYFDSYSKALEEFSQVHFVQKSSYDSQIDKLCKIIEMQEEQLKAVETSINENTNKANKIYENYQFFDDLIKKVRELRKTMSWKQIKEKKFKYDIDEKNSTIRVELQ
jgi:predicted ribosome quality control (RQC) complex YloA/Tae2 family protein